MADTLFHDALLDLGVMGVVEIRLMVSWTPEKTEVYGIALLKNGDTDWDSSIRRLAKRTGFDFGAHFADDIRAAALTRIAAKTAASEVCHG